MPFVIDGQGETATLFVFKRTVKVSNQAELDALDLTFPAPLVKVTRAFGDYQRRDLIYYNLSTESWVTLEL